MANNRMRIRCICGAEMGFAKWFGVEWGVRLYGTDTLEEAFDKFFAEHAGCSAGAQYGAAFSLAYESGEQPIATGEG